MNAIRDRTSEWVDGVKCRTAVMLVARRGTVVFHEAYGTLTDQADSPEAQLDRPFPVNSVTKPIVSTAVMCLVEDGTIWLNRSIREYLPEICGPGTDDIEVRHVITHTSGFRDDECWAHYGPRREEFGSARIAPAENQHHSIAHYLACMRDVPSYFTPGSLIETDDAMDPHWDADLFMNAVTGSVI
jgi:CubicO group peptidase (beta-lactamase class C family)